jgi:hypothetical protein
MFVKLNDRADDNKSSYKGKDDIDNISGNEKEEDNDQDERIVEPNDLPEDYISGKIAFSCWDILWTIIVWTNIDPNTFNSTIVLQISHLGSKGKLGRKIQALPAGSTLLERMLGPNLSEAPLCLSKSRLPS